MTWLTWRQFRIQYITALAGVAVFAILLGITGPHLASMYSSSGINSCHSNCTQVANSFISEASATSPYQFLYLFGIVIILVVPVIIGIFWGAPLIAREFETGTFRLIWTQTVTRRRWLTVKLLLTGLTAMAVTEGLSLIEAWWVSPINRAVGKGGSGSSVFGLGRFSPLIFATHGITPLGYAAFAFALGATTGVLFRRTITAMAVTLAIFALAQLAVPLWVRPHLFSPAHTTTSLSSVSHISFLTHTAGTFSLTAGGLRSQPGAWILSSGAVDAAGKPVTTIPAACVKSGTGPGSRTSLTCLTNHGIRVAVTYQPASRYWPLQWVETAIYLAVALALTGYCFWRLGRRLS
jgi:ABC-type transport system involved in multi-copper enzyme maturation permease subunit